MNTTTKSNSKEFIEIPSNSTMAKDITSYKKNKFTTKQEAFCDPVRKNRHQNPGELCTLS